MEMSEITLAGGLIAISNIAKPVVETGCRLIEQALGKPLQVSGSLMADHIYRWQVENRVRTAARAAELLKRKNLPATVLPPGFLLPLLSDAGNADDPDLQEIWASLLSGAMAENSRAHPLFLDTARRMSPGDARWLDREVISK